jgi:NitT/TauT family transport system permease protein
MSAQATAASIAAGQHTTAQHAVAQERALAAARVFVARVALFVTFMVVWELASGRLVDPFFASSPSAVAGALWRWLADGSLVRHVLITTEEMTLGFGVGAAVGVATGILLGRNEVWAKLLEPFILAINSLPKPALAPLFVLWFGIDIQSKVALTAMVVFFLTFWNTFAGVRDVDTELLDTIRVMGATPRQLLLRVVLPSSLVWIFLGLKVAVPYALIGAVLGEMLAANRGLGYLIARSAGRFDTAGVFAALFVLMLISLALSSLLRGAEARLLHWRGHGSGA